MARRRITDDDRRAADEAIATVSRQVKFDVTQYTVAYLVDRMRAGRYYIPDYQRAFVWNSKKQSQFVESVLIGLPVPFVFFYDDQEGRFEIVDGSQRLRSLRAFMDGELRLTGLQLVHQLNGFGWDDLTDLRRRRFEERSIRGILLENDTTPETRTEMFRRINTGGRAAEPSEIRRGSLPGPFMDLVKTIAEEDQKFIVMTPMSEAKVEQREREELATRFFAYRDTWSDQEPFPGYRDDPANYLYEWVKNANDRTRKDPQLLARWADEFEQMLTFVDHAFPTGFRKSPQAESVPRVRFEALAVGTALALCENPDLVPANVDVERILGAEFDRITRSDAANVKSSLLNRIEYVRTGLLG